jgi:hypothetical protein
MALVYAFSKDTYSFVTFSACYSCVTTLDIAFRDVTVGLFLIHFAPKDENKRVSTEEQQKRQELSTKFHNTIKVCSDDPWN